MPLDEIVVMATGWVVERGHAFDEQMGWLLAQQFYTGRDRKRAARKLQGLLSKSVADAVARRRSAQRDEYNEMAAQLVAEGWEYRTDPTGVDAGLWLHVESYTTVNRMGGFFRTWEEATHVTFHSETRQALLRRESFHKVSGG